MHMEKEKKSSRKQKYIHGKFPACLEEKVLLSQIETLPDVQCHFLPLPSNSLRDNSLFVLLILLEHAESFSSCMGCNLKAAVFFLRFAHSTPTHTHTKATNTHIMMTGRALPLSLFPLFGRHAKFCFGFSSHSPSQEQ